MAQDKDLKTPNVPPLRFPGFSDDWDKQTLGKIGKPYNGLSGKSGDDFGQGSPYITYKSIFDNSKVDISRVEYVTISENERIKSSQNTVEYGDIFFTTSSETPKEVGMTSVLLDDIEDCYLNSFCFGYRLLNKSKTLPTYFRFYLRSIAIRNKLSILAQGSTRFNISKSEVMRMVINLPDTSEQEKIATLLNAIDERIATQNKIIEDLKKLKSAISWRIFENATLIKLGELCEVIMGQSPSSSSYNIAGYGIPLIQGNLDIEEGMTISRIYTSEPTKISLCGDLILTVRAPVGIVAKNKMEVCIGRGVCALRNKTSIPTSYIYHALDYYGYKWSQIEQGSTFSSVNGDDIRSFAIPIVDDIEHACAFLSNIDAFIKYSIDLHSNYLKQKQYLLSQMFI